MWNLFPGWETAGAELARALEKDSEMLQESKQEGEDSHNWQKLCGFQK